MNKYKQLVKDKRYTVHEGRSTRTGIYLGRYYNKALKQWHYHFELFYGTYYTPAAKECTVVCYG